MPLLGLVACVGTAGCSGDPDGGGPMGGGGGNPTGTGGGAPVGAGGGSGGGVGGGGAVSVGDGLGAADFAPGELDDPSNGGTITFQSIGATGWYPSRRDPDVGPCDARDTGTCCLAREEVTSDALTPWDEDLILTLRGPMQVKQLAVYQPGSAGSWALVSAWDARDAGHGEGLAFRGNRTEIEGFDGAIGTECLVDVASDRPFACGPGSEPYCPASSSLPAFGWEGSKLFVLLARMPHADEGVGTPCSNGPDGNWYDAPWIGLSLGELVRAGAFSDCHCYAKDPQAWWEADGCGQFNVFEVVNDNNDYTNLEVFSTNFFGYAGYIGEGPCGDGCDVSKLGPEVDLIDKGESVEAASGGIVQPPPIGGPGVAFRRPTEGFRYFLILLDVASRQVQLAMVHPSRIPASLEPLLPHLPEAIPQATVDDALALRLPR